VDEGRKRVLGIMAAILAARKLCQLESTLPSPALNSIIADAVIFAEWIMQRMQKKSPVAFIRCSALGRTGLFPSRWLGELYYAPACLCKTQLYCANLRWL
jgi:hypothetical protein